MNKFRLCLGASTLSAATLAGALLWSPAAGAETLPGTIKAPTQTRAAPMTKPSIPSKVETNGRRVIALGDLHGDLMQTIRALRSAGLVDETGGTWIGGDTILVQVGDILDRGDHELAILRLFRRLTKQAEKVGGAVYVLNGNHEIMNVAGDFRYVTAAAYKEFDQNYAMNENANPKVMQTVDGARRELLRPGSKYARELAHNPTILQVGDTLFAHAGVLPEHVDVGFDKINERVSGWMDGRYSTPPPQVLNESGVVWNRTYGGEPGDMYGPQGACPILRKVLQSTEAKRMVVGHTPQEKGVNSECRGQLWRIDVGQSRGIMGATPEVIEIKGDTVTIIRAKK
eukprot:CAMPEP_0196578186 /NCGR_PEP_ID=MMETSP1081-20130531/7135_1 /TAXON_ID=36882 /ORGANISM="Pyramimonas amylifera, Strain CCMP720" /LENGTH=341 /DNA_ID=CAMNT_0041897323 /DNA_START=165 /DNA_END=1190 /DNA_ORIENTATION=+